MKLSIVTTIYQSASYVNEFYERATRTARQIAGDDYEIIFVNDGSVDNGLDFTVNLTKKNSNVIVIDLSRNFGHHKALMTGLSNAKGEKVFLIDSDLEEQPEWLLSFNEQMEQQQCDVVFGVQKDRKGNMIERWSGQMFYHFFQALTGFNLPKNIVTSRLMVRRYIDALLSHREREIFILGLWHITGFDQQSQIIKKLNKGQTTYTFRKKISLLVNSITSFSNTPLVFIFYIGIFIFLTASFYIIFLVSNWLFISKPISGWTSVMASLWFIGGMVISFIGVIGIYLSKIFSETKQRPYTIVKQIYGQKKV